MNKTVQWNYRDVEESTPGGFGQMELALKTTARTALRDEQALVEAARDGDDRAFEQLYARYRDRVTAFINSKVRDHGRAEDISQEVFMAALRQLRASYDDLDLFCAHDPAEYAAMGGV